MSEWLTQAAPLLFGILVGFVYGFAYGRINGD